jgi:hypothetical protein
MAPDRESTSCKACPSVIHAVPHWARDYTQWAQSARQAIAGLSLIEFVRHVDTAHKLAGDPFSTRARRRHAGDELPDVACQAVLSTVFQHPRQP